MLQNQAPQSKPEIGLSDIIPAAITTAQTSLSVGQSDGIINSNPPEQTYADAIRKPPVPAALSIPVRQAVVSAVYADFD